MKLKYEISWQDIAITLHYWKEFLLGSMKNSEPVSVYEFKYLNLLQKSIFLSSLQSWNSLNYSTCILTDIFS